MDLEQLGKIVVMLSTASSSSLLAVLLLVVSYFYRRDFLKQRVVQKEAHERRDVREDTLLNIIRDNAAMFTRAVQENAQACAKQAAVLESLPASWDRFADRMADLARDARR